MFSDKENKNENKNNETNKNETSFGSPKTFFPAALNFGFGILRKLLPYPQLPKLPTSSFAAIAENILIQNIFVRPHQKNTSPLIEGQGRSLLAAEHAEKNFELSFEKGEKENSFIQCHPDNKLQVGSYC